MTDMKAAADAAREALTRVRDGYHASHYSLDGEINPQIDSAARAKVEYDVAQLSDVIERLAARNCTTADLADAYQLLVRGSAPEDPYGVESAAELTALALEKWAPGLSKALEREQGFVATHIEIKREGGEEFERLVDRIIVTPSHLAISGRRPPEYAFLEPVSLSAADPPLPDTTDSRPYDDEHHQLIANRATAQALLSAMAAAEAAGGDPSTPVGRLAKDVLREVEIAELDMALPGPDLPAFRLARSAIEAIAISDFCPAGMRLGLEIGDHDDYLRRLLAGLARGDAIALAAACFSFQRVANACSDDEYRPGEAEQTASADMKAAADAAREALTRVLATYMRSDYAIDGSIDAELDPDERREIEAEVAELCDVIAALAQPSNRATLIKAHGLLQRWADIGAASGAGDPYGARPAIASVELALDRRAGARRQFVAEACAQ